MAAWERGAAGHQRGGMEGSRPPVLRFGTLPTTSEAVLGLIREISASTTTRCRRKEPGGEGARASQAPVFRQRRVMALYIYSYFVPYFYLCQGE